jgi:hypothetical protein
MTTKATRKTLLNFVGKFVALLSWSVSWDVTSLRISSCPQAANLRSAIAVRTGRTAEPAFHPYCALRRNSTKTIVLLTFFSFAS